VGGATIFAYACDGVLCVSVDLDGVEACNPVWAMYGPPDDRLVPVRISVQETEVFRAGPGVTWFHADVSEWAEEGPARVPACLEHGDPPHRHDSDGEPCL
jgi:hypothetical protein